MPVRFLCLLFAVGFTANLRAADPPLVVDLAHSRIEVVVKATVDSFVGRLTAYEPELKLGDDGRVSAARLEFHFRDVVTGKDKRDKAMHAWQETEKFPDAEFVLSSIEPGSGGTATAFGRLTLHGVTRDLRFPISINHEGVRYAVDGDATIDTREYGLPVIRMFGVLKVDPLVHVRFHLQAARETVATTRR